MIENLEIKKSIDQLDPNFIGFLELLDLIEILLMKSQILENSKVIGYKRASYINCQKRATIQTSQLSSIRTEIDSIHLKIELIIQKLRKFNPKTFESIDIG